MLLIHHPCACSTFCPQTIFRGSPIFHIHRKKYSAWSPVWRLRTIHFWPCVSFKRLKAAGQSPPPYRLYSILMDSSCDETAWGTATLRNIIGHPLSWKYSRKYRCGEYNKVKPSGQAFRRALCIIQYVPLPFKGSDIYGYQRHVQIFSSLHGLQVSGELDVRTWNVF